jgi:hypothetical protein
MHGGAAGAGAPLGNQNALKSGRFTRAMLEERRIVQRLRRAARKAIDEIGGKGQR